MNQRAYSKRLPEKFDLDEFNEVHTLAYEDMKPIQLRNDDKFALKWPDRKLVSALMYVATPILRTQWARWPSTEIGTVGSIYSGHLLHRVQLEEQGRDTGLCGCSVGKRLEFALIHDRIRFFFYGSVVS